MYISWADTPSSQWGGIQLVLYRNPLFFFDINKDMHSLFFSTVLPQIVATIV
jgi:hypothetical protein